MEHVQVNVTNPWMIMAINMTIVFGVLILLGVIMKIIYWVDPTRIKKAKEQAKAKEVAAQAAAAPAPVAPVATNNDEVIAVITAAITAMGYSASQIATVRPRTSKKWSYEGRLTGRM